jgi:hypothetical protein
MLKQHLLEIMVRWIRAWKIASGVWIVLWFIGFFFPWCFGDAEKLWGVTNIWFQFIKVEFYILLFYLCVAIVFHIIFYILGFLLAPLAPLLRPLGKAFTFIKNV